MDGWKNIFHASIHLFHFSSDSGISLVKRLNKYCRTVIISTKWNSEDFLQKEQREELKAPAGSPALCAVHTPAEVDDRNCCG